MSESEYGRAQYDSLFERVAEAVARWRSRHYVLPDIDELLALPRGQAVMKVRSLRKLHTAEAAKRLCQVSEARRDADPRLALRLAELAVFAARSATVGDWVIHDGSIERDVLAECLATLGNTHRILGNTKEARQHLREASRFVHLGTGDPLVEARVERLTAVLLLDTGYLEEALELYNRCHATYTQLGDEEQANRVLPAIALVHLRAGRPNAALRCVYDCYKKSRAEDAPTLKGNLLNLVALAQLDLGEPVEARRVAQLIQGCSRRPENRAAKVRAEWIEARALLAMGRWREGVEGLDQAREELVEVGALADAALAHLELALAHADACHWEEASEIARQAFGALAAAGLEGQALIALRTVARAAEDRELTSRTLRRAIAKVNTGR